MDTIKTIYLACETRECLVEDIQRAFAGYAAETDYEIEGGGIHLIGDISRPVYDPQTGEQTGEELIGRQHANVYVPPTFDEMVFQTRMSVPPDNPVNQLAL